MDKSTPRPVQPPAEVEDSTPPRTESSASHGSAGSAHGGVGAGFGDQSCSSRGLDTRAVSTYQAHVAHLSERSEAAASAGDYQRKRTFDYALALAYVRLGEALLIEAERIGLADEWWAEEAMSCFSDAATLFHAQGASPQRDSALRRARYAYELYSR